MMGRALLSFCLLLPFLFSMGHATLNFHDVWNLVLPHLHSTEEALPNQIPHGVTTSLPTPGEAGDDSSAGGVSDHHQYLVDFGNKAWPNVYYSRRDRLGTLDWGTKSWPYIYYTSREDKYFPSAKSNAAAGEPADASHGRKLGKAFRLY